MHMKRLIELGVLSMEKRRRHCCLQLPDCRTGLENGTSLSSEVHHGGTRANRHKLQWSRFHILDKREKYTTRMGQTWDRVAQRCSGISIFRDVQDSLGPDHLDLMRPV